MTEEMIRDKREVCACPLCTFKERARKSGATRHLRNARREILLAFKSLIEGRLERLDEQDKAQAEGQARKVEIQ
ncbi:MAG: hypothetical protein AB1641_16245 [Thermodesulfobacteriota bacterium]